MPSRPSLQNSPRPTPEFLRNISRLAEQLGAEAGPVLESLAEALAQLKIHSWDGSLELMHYGKYGDSFGYRFHPDYVLVFRRETIRDEHMKPIEVRLYYKAIYRFFRA